MNYLTNDKLVIVGAGGMIGSNMVQSVLMLGLTPNVCLYDIYEPGVHGVFDEIQQCAFPGANVTYYAPAVEDMGNPEKVAEAAKKAFTGAKYIISSGGAPRKAGMTREDLLKGNCKIAADFGDNIKKYCPDVEHVVVIFNPADVTALTTLIHSGLKPNQLTSLAALDSTRLQQALALEFGVQQDKVTGAHTYGGHGEQMAVFASQVKVDGKPLAEMGLSDEAGCYADIPELGFKDVMMALPTTIDKSGVHYTVPTGTKEEMADLQKSYEHLCNMRQEVIDLGIIPPINEWNKMNPNLK